MSRLQEYQAKLKSMLDTMFVLADCVAWCERDGQSTEMFELVQKLYKEEFASKREKQQFGCFIAFCLSTFEFNISKSKK